MLSSDTRIESCLSREKEKKAQGAPGNQENGVLPGEYHEYGEKIETTAVREVFEETGIQTQEGLLKLVGVYSDPARDRRGHNVSVCFFVELDKTQKLKPGDDAKQAQWFTSDKTPAHLAFDHDQMIKDAHVHYFFNARVP